MQCSTPFCHSNSSNPVCVSSHSLRSGAALPGPGSCRWSGGQSRSTPGLPRLRSWPRHSPALCPWMGVSPPPSASPSFHLTESRGPRENHEITFSCANDHPAPHLTGAARWLHHCDEGQTEAWAVGKPPARSCGTPGAKRGPAPHRRARKGALLYLLSSFPLLFSSPAPLRPPRVPGSRRGGGAGRGGMRERKAGGRRKGRGQDEEREQQQGPGDRRGFGGPDFLPQCPKAAAPKASD